MRTTVQRQWKVLVGALAILLGLAVAAPGALINLQAYVLYALMNESGTIPLADGSLVQIIGSEDAVADPMTMLGSNVISTVSGDDIVLSTITIQSAMLGSNGTFYAGNIYYDSDEIHNVYIRFFDTTGPITGLISWGQSDLFTADEHQFGVNFIDFGGIYAATNENNFVVIPEPGTLNLMLVWLGMVGALRASRLREREATRKTGSLLHEKLFEVRDVEINTYDRF